MSTHQWQVFDFLANSLFRRKGSHRIAEEKQERNNRKECILHLKPNIYLDLNYIIDGASENDGTFANLFLRKIWSVELKCGSFIIR